MNDTYVLDAIRTPIGRFGAGLANVRPDDLAAHVVKTVVSRAPDLDPAGIDDVFFGDANGAGEDNRNVARMAVLLAGLPTSIPGMTVNRLCGSGLEALIDANRAVAVGDVSLAVVGGVESMTRAPFVLPKSNKAFPATNQTMYSTALGWRMVNPAMPGDWTISLGEATEVLAEKYGITREAQDAFAVDSHRKAAAAWDAGVYADEVVPMPGVDLERDESIRPDSTVESLAKLKPAFRPEGTVTAGNASPLNDGAAALLVGDDAAVTTTGRAPLARIVARGVSGVDPQFFGIGPVEAATMALRRAGIGWGDLVQVELNEAFAAQSLACLADWRDLDPSLVNVHGGAIALGHPLGASGARIVGHLARSLHERGGGFGLAAICIGVGQGLAMVLEAC
ncbi:thiolase family protein [Jatrophihabitans endophyticus]|uniref:thiolase family protein n=1 Tax=Jatrophihabitans endophyticus TaxID=1206085 RepID=UPI001A03B236|nr:thiolase family protein [Jatrophihabitans endophyticus]MBE7187877.1 thiolase family protein [Jatrophihabitans endophyticus]